MLEKTDNLLDFLRMICEFQFLGLQTCYGHVKKGDLNSLILCRIYQELEHIKVNGNRVVNYSRQVLLLKYSRHKKLKADPTPSGSIYI